MFIIPFNGFLIRNLPEKKTKKKQKKKITKNFAQHSSTILILLFLLRSSLVFHAVCICIFLLSYISTKRTNNTKKTKRYKINPFGLTTLLSSVIKTSLEELLEITEKKKENENKHTYRRMRNTQYC